VQHELEAPWPRYPVACSWSREPVSRSRPRHLRGRCPPRRILRSLNCLIAVVIMSIDTNDIPRGDGLAKTTPRPAAGR
jgi:hypothetical protein